MKCAITDAYGTPNSVFADADAGAFMLKRSTLASYYNGTEIAPDQRISKAPFPLFSFPNQLAYFSTDAAFTGKVKYVSG